MTDPRKAKSLGEAALNPDGTYNALPHPQAGLL